MLVMLQILSLQRAVAVAVSPRGSPVLSTRTRLDEFRASTTLLSLGHADTVKPRAFDSSSLHVDVPQQEPV